MRLVRRILIAIVALVVIGVVAGVGAGGWYLSDILKRDALMPDHKPSDLDMQVVRVSDGQVTLRVTPATGETAPWNHEGVWGVRWDGGYGQVGAISQLNEGQVVREFKTFVGELRPGVMARLEGYAFPGEPMTTFGIPFREVQYTLSLGEFTAWYVEGKGSTWVIFVHGRNAELREGLRILPTLVDMGYPTLLITYRNDEGAPPNPDGLLRYGQTEWQDLEGAVRYALQHGAQDVVLVGISMGGAIVANFLYQSDQAASVRGVILDAPMVNFNSTIDLGVERRGYPVIVAGIAKGMSQFRFGVQWRKLDYLKDAERLKAPVLLFHGDADETVPVATSDALAKARQDIVRYVRVPGALHVGSWNRDPAAYEAAVRTFLGDVGRS
ncbi:MAG: alpha/beta fold hydrolase [Chloroflexi bacterium]|nr:alpha/beta fold hydrolase [Chloroflexota bacterium]